MPPTSHAFTAALQVARARRVEPRSASDRVVLYWGEGGCIFLGPIRIGKLGGLNEDGEEPSPGIGGGSRRGGWGAGSRSSREGQGGRIREDLLPVRGRVLL